MNRGKQTCRILKDIRRQIAEANGIEFTVSECRYKGDCLGTCPKCEAEVRYLEQNLPVASFRLATTERGRQNADGNRTPDRTEFHTIVAWRGLAEITEKYIRKGSPIYVEGKLRTRQYNATDGSQRSVTEIVADSIELLGSRRSDSQQ